MQPKMCRFKHTSQLCCKNIINFLLQEFLSAFLTKIAPDSLRILGQSQIINYKNQLGKISHLIYLKSKRDFYHTYFLKER